MANFIQNAIAGIGDAALGPLDMVNMAAGLATGVGTMALGGDFWGGFANAPTMKPVQALHEGVGNLVGADPEDESLVRMLLGMSDNIVGMAAVKGLGKLGTKTALDTAEKIGGQVGRRQARKLFSSKYADQVERKGYKRLWKETASQLRPEDLAKNAAKLGLFNTAFTALMPGEMSNFDKAVAAGTGLYYGGKGLKKLKGFKGLSDVTPMTDMEMSEHNAKNIVRTDKRLDLQEEAYKARQGAAERLQSFGLLDEDHVRNLSNEPLEGASGMELDVKLDSLGNPVEKVKVDDLMREISEPGLEFNAMKDGKGELLQELAASEQELASRCISLANGMRNYNLQNPNYFDAKLIAELETDPDTAVKALIRSNPAYTKGLDTKGTEQLFNRVLDLRKQLGREHFVTPKMKSTMQKILDLGHTYGLVSNEDYLRYSDYLQKGFYSPMKSDKKMSEKMEVQKSRNPYNAIRSDATFDPEAGWVVQGVNDPQNVIKTFQEKMYNELEAVVLNIKTKHALKYVDSHLTESNKILDDFIDTAKNVHNDKLAKGLIDIRNRNGKIVTGMTDDMFKSKYKEKVPDGCTDIITYDYGNRFHNIIPNEYKYCFELGTKNPTVFNQIMTGVNGFLASIVTGKYNPFFIPKRIMYGAHGEIAPAIRTELGKDVKLSEIYGTYVDELHESFKSAWAQLMVDSIDKNSWLGNVGLQFHSREEWASKIRQEIEDLGQARNDIMGEVIRGPSGLSIKALPDYSTVAGQIDKAKVEFTKLKNWVDNTTPVRMLDMVKGIVDDAGMRTVLRVGREKLPDETALKRYINNVTKKMSDTRRRGAGNTWIGKTTNAIQDYMPWGGSAVQGLVGKFAYIPTGIVGDSVDYIKRTYKLYRDSNGQIYSTFASAYDTLGKLGSVMAQLPDNVVFDTLWKSIAIPTAVCYLWNNMNEENSETYHKMKPYEKANKLVLTNAFGNNVNMAIPIDQEWSVLKNVFEIMLDSTLGLGHIDAGNPAYSYKQQMVWSLGQDLGLSLPVAAEAGLNAFGYKSNLDIADIVANGNLPFDEVNDKMYRNIDPEFATILQTLTGKLGKMLVNCAEERDVMDYRYAIPFVQINPKMEQRTDTAKFLMDKYKSGQAPQLGDYYKAMNRLKEQQRFYKRNGCTRKGERFGSQEEADKYYKDQMNDLTNTAYRAVQ